MKKIKKNRWKFLFVTMLFLLVVCGLCAYIYGSADLLKVLIWCICAPTLLYLLFVINGTPISYGSLNLIDGELKLEKDANDLKEGEYILLEIKKDVKKDDGNDR